MLVVQTKSQFIHRTIITIAHLNLCPVQNILMSTSLCIYHGTHTLITFLKKQITHLPVLGETLRYTANHFNSSYSFAVIVLLHRCPFIDSYISLFVFQDHHVKNLTLKDGARPVKHGHLKLGRALL